MLNVLSEAMNVFQEEEPRHDEILDFFVMGDGLLIPREIFHLIMQFIPAFPYYFVLRSVCSQWLIEFQEHIYANVEHLSLVDDGKPKYYFRDNGQTLVCLKPIGSIRDQHLFNLDGERSHLFDFLAKMFPNVKHLRLGFGSLRPIHFNQCVNTMLPKLTQLETLDILGTVNRRSSSSLFTMEPYQLEVIARSLPSSTKNLNFIGVTLRGTADTLARLKMFSNKGRQSITKATSLPYYSTIQSNLSPVDIQSCSLSYLFLNQDQLNMNDWETLQGMYSHFEASVVDSLYHDDYPLNLSPVSYLTYMSKKEGVVLSYMKDLRRDTDEIVEATIDTVVREYPYFQPLLSLAAVGCKNAMIQSIPQTKWDLQDVVKTDNGLLLRTLELLTDPSRMKYPELVFNIDSTVSVGTVNSTPITLLSFLITRCSVKDNDRMLNLTKRVTLWSTN